MGICTVVILGDEHWGCYSDGYNGGNAFQDIKRLMPYATLVGGWGNTIAIDIDKGRPEMVFATGARFDYLYEQNDLSPWDIKQYVSRESNKDSKN